MNLPGDYKLKFLTAISLIKLLKKLPPDAVVLTNSANNLSVYKIVDGKLKILGIIGFDRDGDYERD
jgi:hypothetical protein